MVWAFSWAIPYPYYTYSRPEAPNPYLTHTLFIVATQPIHTHTYMDGPMYIIHEYLWHSHHTYYSFVPVVRCWRSLETRNGSMTIHVLLALLKAVANTNFASRSEWKYTYSANKYTLAKIMSPGTIIINYYRGLLLLMRWYSVQMSEEFSSVVWDFCVFN